MCPPRLTLHFIAAPDFLCRDTVEHQMQQQLVSCFAKCNSFVLSLQWVGYNPYSFYGQPPPSLTVIISQLQEMMNNMLVVSVLSFLLQSFKSAALSHFETSSWNNCTRLFSFSPQKLSDWFDVFFTFPFSFRQLTSSWLNFLLFEISCFRFQELTWFSLAYKEYSIVC